MVGCAVVCCLGEVDNELGYRRIRDKQVVESEEEALDGVELGLVGLLLRLRSDCVGFFLLRLGDESSLGVSWLRRSSGHSQGRQRQPITK